ncbi:MAG: Crp/Fnr family transcriptional regulator [Clostridia bacterium]
MDAFLKNSFVHLKKYQKGETAIHEGEICTEIGIVAQGKFEGLQYSINGTRELMGIFEIGDIFGDVLAMTDGKHSPVTVNASTDGEVYFVPFANFEKSGTNREILLKNLIKIISKKYFSLLFRANCLSKRTIREKILFYLSKQSEESKQTSFNIPFDRAALADFLNVDRSALSRELSAMKKEKTIDFYKNTFKLLDNF